MQTIWPAFHTRHAPPPEMASVSYLRERWTTPDGDFIDVDFHAAEPHAADQLPRQNEYATPTLVLFHGLEGSSSSHYALAFARESQRRGVNFAVAHFRGCSGEINHAPRAYHSGDHEEIAWILQRLRQRSTRPLLAVGVSLGGNSLLRWAQEAGQQAAQIASAVVSISAPVDLVASGYAMGRGFNRMVYTRMFLSTMKPKALQKLTQHPGLFSAQALQAARTLYEFDNVFTAPLHGFKNTVDYWQRASAKPHLMRIHIPALLVNALNDPFVPFASLPRQDRVGQCVALWQPRLGGHVGFSQGPWPGHIRALPEAVLAWAAQQSSIVLKDCLHG